ncbi:MAG: hypothetical protein V1737_00070 [Chloroflexota bacterium]
MFYECSLPEKKGKQVSVLVSLMSAESKRLIAKAVAALPEVKKALEKGIVIIARGTTDAFVAEEIIGRPLDFPRCDYTRGCIVDGELRVNLRRGLGNDFVLRQGKVQDLREVRPQDVVKEFGADDVFIKGASAVDPSGQAGVLVAGAESGTVGYALPSLMGRGAHLIVPVGLEKLIPSVDQASQKCGVFRFKYSTGLPCGLIPTVNGKVVTEVQALAVLAGVSATHVASGGIGGSEGTVVLVAEGNEENVEKAFRLVASIKGEPPVSRPETTTPPAASMKYDADAQWKHHQAVSRR